MFKAIYNFFHRYYHRRYHGIYQQAKKLFIFDLFLLALALIMLVASLFFFFWHPGITDLIDLSLTLGNGRIKSGEKINIKAEFTNRSKLTLHEISLVLRLPAGFVADQPQNTFPINDLAPGSRGEIDIPGRLWTNIKTDENMVASLNYRAGDNKFTEQKLTAVLLHIPESIISADLELPDSSFANVSLPFHITLKNNGADTINNLALSPTWPADLKLIKFDTDITNFSLISGEQKTFSGSITTPNRNGTLPLQMITQIDINNHFLNQAIAEKNINIVAPQFFSKVEIPNNLSFATPGETIPLKITFKNDNSYSIQNLKINLNFPSGIVDLPLTAQANMLKIISGKLVIDSSKRTILGNAAAGQADEFSINLKLKTHFSLTAPQNNLTIQPVIEGMLPGIAGQQFSQPGISASLKLATEVSINAAARYYTDEEDQLGRGPLPPQVGQTTKYWIFVQIFNTSNNIQNANFNATLPAGIDFTGKQSVTIGSAIKFDPTTRNISWNQTEIPSFSQTGLYFEVATTPMASQIGQSLTLLKNLKFTATENATERKIILSQAEIKNILPTKDKGFNKGVNVIE